MKRLFTYIFPLLFLVLLLLIKDKALTQDLGRHVALGGIITRCHCVPKTNLFSYTMPNQPFINHHWFSEVVMYEMYSLGGILLIVAAKIALFLCIFALIIYLARKRASSFWIIVLSVPYVLMFSERFDARPEIFSFLFLTIFLIAIERYKKSKNVSLLWILPFLEIVWANMHIYFLVGVGLLGLLVIEQLILHKAKIDKRLFIIMGITGLVTLINPNGLSGALYPLEVLRNYGYSIEENQNIFFLNTFFFNVHILIFEILSVIAVIGMAFHRRKEDLFYIFTTVFAIIASYWMIRNFPLFILLTFPFVTYLYTRIEEKYCIRDGIAYSKGIRFGIGTIMLVIVVVVFFQQISSPFFGFGYVDPGKPGVDFLKQNSINGRFFNSFDNGSYLIYRLYPYQKVFVDGRPEAYSPAFFNMYKKMQVNSRYFADRTSFYHINAVVFSQTDSTPWAQDFLSWMISDTNWKLVYADGYTIIFLKNNSKNKELIAKYASHPVR